MHGAWSATSGECAMEEIGRGSPKTSEAQIPEVNHDRLMEKDVWCLIWNSRASPYPLILVQFWHVEYTWSIDLIVIYDLGKPHFCFHVSLLDGPWFLIWRSTAQKYFESSGFGPF
jgi:hypothetical protein